MRSRALLESDVGELAKRFGSWWTGLPQVYSIAIAGVTLGAYGALFVLAWTFIGPIYGTVVLVATLSLYGFGALRAWGRRERTHETSTRDAAGVVRSGQGEAEPWPAWRLLKAVLVTTTGVLLIAVGVLGVMQGELRLFGALCALGAILALYPFGTRL
jgi:hypothetical protein